MFVFDVSKVGEQCDAVDPPVPRKLRSGTQLTTVFLLLHDWRKGILASLFVFYLQVSATKNIVTFG